MRAVFCSGVSPGISLIWLMRSDSRLLPANAVTALVVPWTTEVRKLASPVDPDISRNRLPDPKTCRAAPSATGSGAGDGFAILTMLAGKAVGVSPSGRWNRDDVSTGLISGASPGMGDVWKSQ